MSKISNAPDKKDAPPPLDALASPPVLDEFAAWQTVNLGRSLSTARAYARHVREFAAFLAGRGLRPATATTHDLNAWQLHLYQQRRNLAAQTRASKLAAVRSWYQWLTMTGRLTQDPSASIVSPRIPPRLPRKFTDDDLRAILAAPSRSTPSGFRDYTLILTLYVTGARVAELCALDTSSLRFAAQSVRVYIHGKGSKERIITVRAPASRILRAYAASVPPGPLFTSLSRRDSGQRLSPSGVNFILKKYGRLVGVPTADVFAHKMRATFATSLHELGHELPEISRQMGHEDVNTTMRYLAISDKTIHKTAISGKRLQSLGVGLD